MAANEGSSNHVSLCFDTIYLKSHEINPPGIRSYIETPTDLKNKYATINPKNKDKCFLYAIGTSVYYEFLNSKNPGNITKNLINHYKKLNTSNINFPPNGRDIDQFEKDNLQIAVSVFEYKGFKRINGEKTNYSNDLNSCIDVRDANIDDEIDKNINIDKTESENEDINDNNKTKKKMYIIK